MIQLNLTNPIAFFDLETTGVNVASDRIVEISILKILVDGTKEIKTKRINPTIPIPKQASEIHGIYDKDVVNEPTFKSIAKSLAEFLEGCDFGGYNSNKFDVPVLVEEFMRADVDFEFRNRKLIDVQNIFHKMEQRTLNAAYKFYCGKEIVNAHSAQADIEATYEVFLSQLERYDGKEFEDRKGNKSTPIKNDMQAIHDFSNMNNNADLAGRIIFNDNGVEVFNFGKHSGKLVEKILRDEPSYFDWMMKGDFPLYTKKVLKEIRDRMKEIKNR